MYSSPVASGPASPQMVINQDNKNQRQGRRMQVKVLYSFDDANKTNCLARLPQPLNIQTAYLNESTQIGIIELRTCIESIVSASPELVAKLGHDYTVYAYDYSEYETPLVGQGMLSRMLAAASSTPMAPAQQSRTMVTGRVCNNILGLFSDGVKETLEVKLRLVPVPVSLQSEYVASMEQYRNPNNIAAEDFDAGAWSAFLRDNPGFGGTALHGNGHLLAAGRDDAVNDTRFSSFALETMNNAANESDSNHTQPQHTGADSGNFGNCTKLLGTNPNSAKTSRPNTPSHPRTAKSQSRPSSRTSQRGRPPLRKIASCTLRAELRQANDELEPEEGPSRKRARTTKADWRGPSSFGANTDSLRVTASTAASIRGHKLSRSQALLVETTSSFDASGRPPTPRPHPTPRLQPSLFRSSTALGHDALAHKTDEYVSPYASEEVMNDTSRSALTSPDAQSHGGSAASTPLDIPSSPPVMRHTSPTPSSPALPRLLDHVDSGFASGPVEELFEDDKDELRPRYKDDIPVAASYNSRNNGPMSDVSFSEVMPGDPRLLPHKILPRPPARPPAQSRPRKPPTKAAVPSSPKPQLPPHSSGVGNHQLCGSDAKNQGPAEVAVSLNLPSYPTSHPRSYSKSYSQEPFSEAASEAPEEQDKTSASKDTRSSAHAKRKKAIQDRLASSVAAGQMPTFCQNCGEVGTPTWRKAFIRIESGSPDHLQLSDRDDGVTAWEPVSKDEDGRITSYRVIRKSVALEELAHFEEISLCNPCGIWLCKSKSMRPPEKWAAALRKEPTKRKRAPAKKKVPQYDPNLGQSSMLTGTRQAQSRASGKTKRASSLGAPEITNESTQQLKHAAAAAALTRAIQSSPPRFPGSKLSPIELDADISPQPTRRLLFPSPRESGEIKSLNIAEAADYHSTAAGPIKRNSIDTTLAVSSDKENLPPTEDNEDDDLRHLFSVEETNVTPRTPKSGSLRMDTFLRTPSVSSRREPLTPRGFLSSAAKRWRNGPETPSRVVSHGDQDVAEMTPFTAQLAQLISEANQQSPSRSHKPDLAIFDDQVPEDNSLLTFSDFSMEDLGTDIPMTTSTPAFFSLYEDPVDSSGALWSDDDLMRSALRATLDDAGGNSGEMGDTALSSALVVLGTDLRADGGMQAER